MHGLSKGAAAMVALFAAIPTVTIISFSVWQVLLQVNNGGALSGEQLFLGLFTGVSFGLAVFSFVYAARRQGVS